MEVSSELRKEFLSHRCRATATTKAGFFGAMLLVTLSWRRSSAGDQALKMRATVPPLQMKKMKAMTTTWLP